MRTLLILLLALVPRMAEAKMMVHYDLAGLLLQADAVVIADKISAASGPSGTSKYKVVRSIRGTRKPGDEIEVWDSHYDTRGHAIEPRAVLFLGTYNNQPQLVASGLRVIEKGKVFRFEQRDNPGPYVMFPQGRDPHDQWDNGGTQLDLAGLEAAIAAAGKRIDAFTAAKAIADPAKRRAAMLALFPAGDARATSFYVDRLAADAQTALAKAGDLDGALLIERRDRSGGKWGSDFATTAQLFAITTDPTKSIELRETALVLAGQRFDLIEDAGRAKVALALLADPSPRLRAAAVAAVAHPANMSTSDAAGQRRINEFVNKAKAAIGNHYQKEQDPAVLAAMLAAYENDFRRSSPPARSTGPLAVATLAVESNSLHASVYCLRPTKIKDSKLIATTTSGSVKVTAFNVTVHCGANPSVGAGGTAPLPAGTYKLAVELATAPATTIPLGTLLVGTDGESQYTP